MCNCAQNVPFDVARWEPNASAGQLTSFVRPFWFRVWCPFKKKDSEYGVWFGHESYDPFTF